jgi:hypothetical protein
MNKWSKYVRNDGIIEKYVKICTYGKICKINIVNFIGNLLNRIYHLTKLIYKVTVKICIYI